MRLVTILLDDIDDDYTKVTQFPEWVFEDVLSYRIRKEEDE